MSKMSFYVFVFFSCVVIVFVSTDVDFDGLTVEWFSDCL